MAGVRVAAFEFTLAPTPPAGHRRRGPGSARSDTIGGWQPTGLGSPDRTSGARPRTPPPSSSAFAGPSCTARVELPPRVRTPTKRSRPALSEQARARGRRGRRGADPGGSAGLSLDMGLGSLGAGKRAEAALNGRSILENACPRTCRAPPRPGTRQRPGRRTGACDLSSANDDHNTFDHVRLHGWPAASRASPVQKCYADPRTSSTTSGPGDALYLERARRKPRRALPGSSSRDAGLTIGAARSSLARDPVLDLQPAVVLLTRRSCQNVEHRATWVRGLEYSARQARKSGPFQ
jgi:hypothetical protein